MKKLAPAFTLEDYCRRYGLELAPPKCKWCAHVLAGVRCPDRDYGAACKHPPHADHSALFRRRDGRLIFTSQPYLGRCVKGANLDQLKTELEAWAASFGLSVRISPEESWHYPGATILYEVWKP